MSTQNTTNKNRLTNKEKASYGFGGFLEQIMANTYTTLAFPIYNIGLKMDAQLLGTALALPRLLDAVVDPVLGNISDNTRSKWGRRKPYIFFGAVFMALALIMAFSPPASFSEQGLFYYLIVAGSLLYISYSVFSIPYNALGYELTKDYNERTSVQAWRMAMISAKALIAPWLLKICFIVGSWFPESDSPAEVVGVFYVAIGMGLIVIIGVLPLLLFCKERFIPSNETKDKLLVSIKSTLSNKAFRVHLITIFLVMVGNFLYNPLNLYLNNYYIYNGDKEAASTMIGYGGTIAAIFGFLAIPVIAWVSSKIGKKMTYCWGLVITGLIYPMSWFLYDPEMPYLQLIVPALFTPIITSCWVLNPSITADICDDDELRTGSRSEGMYSSIWNFSFQLSISIMTFISGLVIAWTGFMVDLDMQTPETIYRMRLVMAILPVITLLFAGYFFYRYFPLTRSRMTEIQAQLKSRNTA